MTDRSKDQGSIECKGYEMVHIRQVEGWHSKETAFQIGEADGEISVLVSTKGKDRNVSGQGTSTCFCRVQH